MRSSGLGAEGASDHVCDRLGDSMAASAPAGERTGAGGSLG